MTAHLGIRKATRIHARSICCGRTCRSGYNLTARVERLRNCLDRYIGNIATVAARVRLSTVKRDGAGRKRLAHRQSHRSIPVLGNKRRTL